MKIERFAGHREARQARVLSIAGDSHYADRELDFDGSH
jgi:hypothetical protein